MQSMNTANNPDDKESKLVNGTGSD